MKPEKLCPIFLHGDYSTEILLKCALYWAELGDTVWFISPKPLNTLPNIWTKPPDKEVLKLMLFIYISEAKDLLIKLSEIHMIPKIPKVIIIKDIEHYWCPTRNELNVSNAAYVTACLQDSLSSYSTKFDDKAYLLMATNNPINKSNTYQTIIDLYFSKNVFDASAENSSVFARIVDVFENKITW